ncbi:MAG: hypothetical protein KTV68_13560 [Acidimicrobiia bacterium]|nr:hypothetical protein [Acidimicrobiia bacterium]MCY4434112.1 hypothetical protein [bacterium]
MDILARNNAPLSLEETDLGDGLTMRRTKRARARRVNSPVAGAYDAREVYLSDKSTGPPSTWRLAAKLVGLTEIVETPPPSDLVQAANRLADIDELIGEIEARGLMFENHVLPQLRPVVGHAVFRQYFLSASRDPDGAASIPSGWLLAVKQHIESVNSDPEPSAEAMSQGFQGIISTIMNWAMTTSWDQLVNWSPPLPSQTDDTLSPIDNAEGDSWITERFTKTYLSEWSVAALRSEWKYLHGQHLSPCDPSEMRVREVSANDLARVMADRLGADPRPSEHLINMLVRPAVNFLAEDRRTEAAALFEAALRVDPQNAIALNNLGFCLLPDDPEQALRHLDSAIDTGSADVEITNANRVLALVLLGRWTSACDLAAAHLNRHSDSSRREPVWLWDSSPLLRDNAAALITCDDIASYVAALHEVAAAKDGEISLASGGSE